MKAPFVVVTVVVACARASVQQAQIPTASKAAPILLMFVFILRIRAENAGVDPLERTFPSDQGPQNVKPSTQPSAIAARRADRQGSATIQPRRSDNWDKVFARPVFSAAIFPRAGAKRNAAGRHVDDERRETARASSVNATSRPSQLFATMLRVEPFTVSPVIPTCSMYLRQLCKFAAKTAGARYIQMKYFHRPNAAIAQRIRRPGHDRQRQFRPNAPAHAFASDRRRRREEGAQENERGIKQSEVQFEKCGQTSLPSWHSRSREWPEFIVSLRREIGMMRLMDDAVEAEAHQAQRADHDPIEFIEAAIFSEQARETPRADRSECRASNGWPQARAAPPARSIRGAPLERASLQ